MACLEYHQGDLDSNFNQNNVHRCISLNVEFTVDEDVAVVVVAVVVGRPCLFCNTRSQHF